jgi:L-ascorbate metabolism protein UlaG (beta-lactamase superfamily)
MHPFEALAVPEGCIGIHWFGQNSFGLKDVYGTILLVDPYFPVERPAKEFIYPAPPLDEKDLKTDLVLLTHEHGDHTCPETLSRIHTAFPKARFYGTIESVLRLRELGVEEELVSVMTAGMTEEYKDVLIHSVYSKPPGGVPEDNIPAPDVEHLGYVIEIGQVHIYISGDLFKTFAEHDELLEPIIRLNPDIGLLTTHPTEGEFPDFAGSVKMAVKLGLKSALPAHYGCFVKRTFDPQIWASGFPKPGPEPIILPYNTALIYCPRIKGSTG